MEGNHASEDNVWRRVEDELQYPRGVLRGAWERVCVVVHADRSTEGGASFPGSHLTPECIARKLADPAINEDTDCCTMSGGGWHTLPPHATHTQKLRMHSDEAFSLRFSRGHNLSHTVHRHLLNLQDAMGGHSVGSNVYVTPPGQQSFPRHVDPQNIFVTQIAGEKTWVISNRGLYTDTTDAVPPASLAIEGSSGLIRLRSEDEPASIPRTEGGYTTFTEGTVTLQRGDRLYLPRGFAHYCTSRGTPGDSPSIHLTVDTSMNCSQQFFYSSVLEMLRVKTRVEVPPSLWERAEHRRSMPFGFLFLCGSCYGRGGAWREAAGQFLQKACEGSEVLPIEDVLREVDTVMDFVAEGFFRSAIPPGKTMQSFCRLSLHESGDGVLLSTPGGALHVLPSQVHLLLSMLPEGHPRGHIQYLTLEDESPSTDLSSSLKRDLFRLRLRRKGGGGGGRAVVVRRFTPRRWSRRGIRAVVPPALKQHRMGRYAAKVARWEKKECE